jgi:hypothetical protein
LWGGESSFTLVAIRRSCSSRSLCARYSFRLLNLDADYTLFPLAEWAYYGASTIYERSSILSLTFLSSTGKWIVSWYRQVAIANKTNLSKGLWISTPLIWAKNSFNTGIWSGAFTNGAGYIAGTE